ncbi:CG-1-domain-containing protein [Coccomyxa subellipsoidea C-169]|uniref:CG-1-domain-containing protein n=1 Tax=Coccomyxa subellipsoidea (strain C-169) TaxID=574566 RepID=I0YTS4_COCSC|nr:CG-1-domain-containing protein [Coccomyxa subellipsoidea C-169]EIE21793.1 CG-1-domain-containing protein [Coccomyxa subellipsoidea C-169]|eukprot:XP_005646337.1 CG-1-domain-containing protein [Coccomyxa subellipsoidea C-169]
MGQLAVPAEQLGSGAASSTEQLPKVLRDILTKARTSWLRNQEVVDLLTNYRSYRFRVSKEPPQKPPGGSLFLFNRKTVRFFRKDGHDWRKKSDGKTVRETHEKLKVGNKEILNCYYAHAEDALQRRCYWLLDGDDNVVLVHYLSSNPHANCVLRSPSLNGNPSFSGAMPLNALEGPPSYPQVGTSTAWDAAPASGMSRTNSVPENFGSSSNGAAGQQPAALPTMFTVTTGDVITRTASGEGAVALELPQLPALRLEFKGTSPSSGPADATLRPACALQSQDIARSLAHSGSTGRLSRDTSSTLAGGLQRRDPSLKLGLGL